jgi:alginate O-acetyltransferase complex protein AlgI
MLFTTINFAVFLIIVFILYWFAAKNNLQQQNVLLLVSSYFFYACWDYRFLFLLMFSTSLDYFTGLKMQKARNVQRKRIWFWLSIIINVGFLGVFKYYNFFAESFATAFSLVGVHANYWTLKVILPVGISFYTFHGLSYIFDVYNGKIKPVTNFVDYSVFVSFFPLLVAGPIERATHLLPQVQKTRYFDYHNAVKGLRQILWGVFKKVVVADSCAEYANLIFDHSDYYSGSTLAMGGVFFAFQIYCDFSGYSDIALGTARLFGIELLRNFAFPYFSRDIAEFWRRWHISLSSWFRDYLYVPLGGSRVSRGAQIRNIFVIFLVSGFWHGANWTFVAWGALNALYFLPLLLLGKNRTNLETVAKGRLFPTAGEFLAMTSTFGLTVFAWIFFRSESLSYSWRYIGKIFSLSFLETPMFPKSLIALISLFMIIEWLGREHQFAIEKIGPTWPKIFRWTFYYVIVGTIFYFGGKDHQFIYFQF